MSARQKVAWVWIKLFETCIVLGAVSIFAMAGVSFGWVIDDRPLAIENPDPNTSYVVTKRIHPGDEVLIHRSFRRTDDCLSRAAFAIVSRTTGTVFPIQNYASLGMPTDRYGTSDLGFMIPGRQAPGKYFARTSLECQRNPLSTVSQRMSDEPFEIVAVDAATEPAP